MKAKVTLSMLDQGMMSAFNFGLNLALLKWWSSEQFGLYSLVFTLSFMLISVQNALITTPYSVLVPSSKHPEPIRQTLSAVQLGLLFGLMLLCALICVWPSWASEPFSADVNLVAISAYLCARWLREYLRAQYAAELQLLPVLLTDLLFIGLVAGGAGALLWLTPSVPFQVLQLNELLWLLTLSQLLASVGMLRHELKRLASLNWRERLADYHAVWQQARWSLLGALTTELQNRGYVLVIGAAFGASWLGIIQAGRVFFGPLNVVTSAWGRVARPTLAKLNAKQQSAAFMRLTHLGSLGFVLFNAVFALALYWAWPWLQTQFFHDLTLEIAALAADRVIEPLSVGWLIVLWAIATVLMQVRGSYSIAIQAQNRFKALSFATLWGALLSVVCWAIIVLLAQPNWVITTVIAAETFGLLYVLRLLLPHSESNQPQVKPC